MLEIATEILSQAPIKEIFKNPFLSLNKILRPLRSFKG